MRFLFAMQGSWRKSWSRDGGIVALLGLNFWLLFFFVFVFKIDFALALTFLDLFVLSLV